MIAEFEKLGRMSWFSHLDLQSTMQRALRRADLPVRYSQGFNPHVNLAFATALSVGAQSRCELMDVELEEAVAPEAFAQRLNACLPEGLKIRRARLADDHAPALTARMAEAGYEVRVPGLDLRAKVEAFLASGEVIVEKRSKMCIRDRTWTTRTTRTASSCPSRRSCTTGSCWRWRAAARAAAASARRGCSTGRSASAASSA